MVKKVSFQHRQLLENSPYDCCQKELILLSARGFTNLFQTLVKAKKVKCLIPTLVFPFLCSICRLLNEFRLQDTMGDVQAKAILPLVSEPINLITGGFYQCSAELRIYLAP